MHGKGDSKGIILRLIKVWAKRRHKGEKSNKIKTGDYQLYLHCEKIAGF